MTTIENSQDVNRYVAPRPLSDDYDLRKIGAATTHRGQPDPADPTDVVLLWGHCADFCNVIADDRTDGLTVTEHGPWCTSRATVFVDGHDPETGQRVMLNAAVTRPYLHGTYHRTATWRRPFREEQVQLTLTDDDERVVNLSVGDALRLAAALTRVCAVADRLDQLGRQAHR